MVSAAPSAGALRQMDALIRAQPEAGAWLALIAETIREAADPCWDSAAAEVRLADATAPAPLLGGATVPLDPAVADGWLRRLLALAGEASPATAPLGDASRNGRLDALGVLNAAINQDAPELSVLAPAFWVDEDALAAIAHLAAMPLLHGCRRRFAAAVAPDWGEGYCPICAGWPTLAESRGLERARRLRCARCGGDWGTIAFRCPFCANTDHRQLGSLVPESGGEARRVETCDRCRGYLKSVATLRAWSADEVALADLATVELDLAAV
ncbi:MAG: formate dehydrogenase accessory protein FdhE, partial [Chloroflexota bacterium]|nr:formate dehydrogenase accessory protein FdhE [Chloroflexota bacterium]